MEFMSSDPILAQARIDFLLRHSGRRGVRQCKKHPPLARMAFPQVLLALKEETGLGLSRWWFMQLCDRLGIERSRDRHPGPAPSLEKKRAQQRARHHRWYQRAKADPEGAAKLQQRAKARWQATLRSRQPRS
jgi:hypothetical protein